jgi:hypothetical protein
VIWNPLKAWKEAGAMARALRVVRAKVAQDRDEVRRNALFDKRLEEARKAGIVVQDGRVSEAERERIRSARENVAWRDRAVGRLSHIPPDDAPEAIDARTRAARRKRRGGGNVSANGTSEGKEWLPRDEWIAGIDDPSIPEAGTWARFEYVDADGVVTKRSIRQWSKRGAYIEGFCMDRREGRTFRQDRISNFRCG